MILKVGKIKGEYFEGYGKILLMVRETQGGTIRKKGLKRTGCQRSLLKNAGAVKAVGGGEPGRRMTREGELSDIFGQQT